MNQVYLDEWPENTSIEWWNEGRRKLNVVIRLFNAWQRDHDCDPTIAPQILNHIEEGRQTWANRDGGSGWRDELEKMERHVRDVLEEGRTR